MAQIYLNRVHLRMDKEVDWWEEFEEKSVDEETEAIQEV